MHNSKKISSAFVLTLLTAMIIVAATSPYVANVRAQDTATVNMLDSVGGNSDPAPGTYTYPDGTAVTLNASPDLGFAFFYWIIQDSNGETNNFVDNPLTLNVQAGVTYNVEPLFQSQDNFLPGYSGNQNYSSDAIVVVLASVGGTTSPGPGSYAIGNATNFVLTATPNSGWQFLHWVIGGGPMNVAHGGYTFTDTPTDNPYTVGHGYGFTYTYQAVFTPVGSTTPPPSGGTGGTSGGTSTETYIIIALVVVVILILVAFGAYAYSRRPKK